jgi:tetratricopeptide (TPR) repeat protein
MPRPRRPVDPELVNELEQAVKDSRQPIAALARAIGCERTTLYKWLDGTNSIPRQRLLTLCELIHLPVERVAAQLRGRGYALRSEDQQPPRPPPTPRQLRSPVQDFVGREQELSAAEAIVAQGLTAGAAPVVGIYGMGGMGKTELAHAIARRLSGQFPDGQLLLNLHGTGDAPLAPDEALRVVIRAYEPTAQLPGDLSQLTAQFCSLLAVKRVLIVADDAGSEAQLLPLLPPAGSALLVTSRRRLPVPGMRAFDLGGLPLADAERLLLAICPRIGSAAPRLAALCGHLPLALRLSAGTLASDDTYSVEHYLADLAEARLAYLRDTTLASQQEVSVEASLQLSYRVLTPALREVLAALSVFPDSFGGDAASAVLARPPPLTATLLGELRRHSLLEWDAVARRYSLHDLVREFAAKRLEDPGGTRERHARYMLKFAERDTPPAQPLGSAWLTSISTEHGSMRAALDWLIESGQRELALRLAVALGPFWTAYDHLQEGDAYLQKLLTANTGGSDALHARALSHAGAISRLLGRLEQATEAYARSRAIFRGAGDGAAYADATFQLGLVRADQGQKRQALEQFRESLATFERVGDAQRAGVVHASLGRIALDQGDLASADDHFARGEALLQGADDQTELAWLLVNRSRLARVQRDYESALALLEEAEDIFRQLRHSQGLGWTLLWQGSALAALKIRAGALEALTESLTLFTRLANLVGQAMAHQLLAELASSRGDREGATTHALAAFQLFAKSSNLVGMGLCLILLGWLASRERSDLPALLGAAEAFIAGSGVRLEAAEYTLYYSMLEDLRERYAGTAGATLWARGKTLLPSQVVSMVMGEASFLAAAQHEAGGPTLGG